MSPARINSWKIQLPTSRHPSCCRLARATRPPAAPWLLRNQRPRWAARPGEQTGGV